MNVIKDTIYKCPKCNECRIEAEVIANAVLTQIGKSTCCRFIENSIDEIRDSKRCKCLVCGNTGYLYQWEVRDEDSKNGS